MGKLTVSLKGVVESEVPLEQEQITIGRQPTCDIRIDDLAVSGQHAKVITIVSDSFLEDLGSTNGTYVNGSLIKKCALNDGDMIGIGNHILKYDKGTAGVDEDEFAKTMVIKPGMPSHQMASQAQAQAIEKAEQKEMESAVSPAAGMKTGQLQVLSGPARGKELKLTKAMVTLGRPGEQVAVISRRRQGYFLTHIEGAAGSKRFPVVNGKTIGVHAHPLSDHDVIELAGVKMEFYFVD